jgi:hypothetical protein
MTVAKGARTARSNAQVWRNLVLVQATSGRQALRKAETIGKRTSGDAGGTLLLGGRPAQSLFVGIADAGLVDDRLMDGVEVMVRLADENPRAARRRKAPRAALLSRLQHETRQLHASRNEGR